ncbi:MAG TPA: membrane protein insertase YidC [Steroidobacteraceae bacterium]|jgi:YidC/Oxa1 family membrane protein insertase|nr:membrane protein insertase YidC [Steroidobacteraceae bacterium]
MTNNIRVFLWLGLALALWLNYSQWQMDYAPKVAPPATDAAAPNGGTSAAKTSDIADSVPQATQTAPLAGGPPEAANSETQAQAATDSPESAGAKKIRVTTDVLVLDISLTGGTLVHAELPGYPIVKGQPAPVVLFNTDSPSTNYVLRTGLANPKNPNSPTHQAIFSAAADQFSLAPGQDELRVPLTWTDGNGVTVTKTFVFTRSMFTIGLEYRIDNGTQAPWQAAPYSRIVRTDPPVERSMFHVESYATRGPAIYDGKKYTKLKIDKKEDAALSVDVTNGWIAGMQHHFVSAVIPDHAAPYHYTLQVNGREYALTALGQLQTVPAGGSKTLKETLFVGPKLQKQLDSAHPELSRVADYGVLTLVSRPLFWLLDHAHSFVRNWGLAIMLVTFLLKLMFYPLSEKAGRSMARMRSLAPRMKALQETYKDDRSKLGQATMELYKQEKVNPLAGCLPMIIQMPVFLAFYWVLLESVEMRQAPFFGWINDLSARDPFFILPVLNGLAMWGQSKLNPPPPDPVQARIFQFMPVVFSVMFALFPAGLVLYWVTNTGLSILQQWNINRKIALEDVKRRK